MAPIAERFVRIRPDMDRFGPDVKRGIDDGADWDGHGKRSGSRLGAGFTSGAASAISVGMKGIAIGAGAAIAAGIGIKRFLIDPASDLSETINKTNVVFGKSAPAIQSWAKTSATAFGLSQQAALAAASQFGDMFQQLGFTDKAASKASTSLVKTAADLGSFHNVDPSDVLQRIGGALRGEYDSLQQLIPNINAARVEQEALAETHKKSAKDLTAAEKATATLAIVQRDGANAANDFAETSAGAANQQRIFTARMDDLKAKIGSALLPAFSAALGGINGFIAGLEGSKGPTEGFAGFVADVGSAARTGFDVFRTDVLPVLREFVASFRENVLPVLRDVVGFIVDHVVPTWKGILTDALEGARSAFRSIGEAIERNRPQLESMLAAFKSLAAWVYDNVLPLFGPYLRDTFRALGLIIGASIDIISNMWAAWQKAASIVSSAVHTIRSVISGISSVVETVRDAFEGARAAVADKVGAAVALVRGLPGRAVSALGDLGGSLAQAGRELIAGFVDGIKDKIGAVKDTLTGLTDKLTSWKGPPAKDRSLLRSAGVDIIRGLVHGLTSGTASVQTTLGKLTDLIKEKFTGKAQSGLLAYAHAQGKALRGLEKVYEAAAERVKDAKEKLSSALADRDQFAGGIASGLRGDASIFGGLDGTDADNPASIGGLSAFMNAQVGKLRQFATDLAGLTARGLSGGLIGQIAGGGLGRGATTARLLADANPDTIAGFNALQAEIDAISAGIGSRAANSVFGTDITDLRADLAASELQLRRANATLDSLADKTGDAIVAALRRAGIIAPTALRVGV